MGAALAAWVAVVGGGKLWARFESAEIPATQTISALPRELLITEGLQTLLVPVLLGATAALLFRTFVTPASGPEERADLPEARTERQARADQPKATTDGPEGRADESESAGKRERRRWWNPARDLETQYGRRGLEWIVALGSVGLLLIVLAIAEVNWVIPIAAALAAAVVGAFSLFADREAPRRVLGWYAVTIALVGLVVAFFLALEPWAVAAMVVLTVGAVLITAVFLARAERFHALILFAAFILWAGALGYVQEAGDRTPRLELGAVTRIDGTVEQGYYLGRTSDRVYLAQNTEGKPIGGKGSRHVLVLNEDDVARVIYGAAVVLPEEGGPSGEKQEAPGPEAQNGGGGSGNGDDETGPEPQPEPEPEQQTPALPLPDPVERAPGELNGTRVELHVIRVLRKDRDLHLDARLVNVSGVRGTERSITLANHLDDGDSANEMFTADGLRLVDSREREMYPVMYDDEGECACSHRLNRGSLEPGESIRLWAAFPAPAGTLERVHLAVPGFGWINDLDVR